MQLDCSNKTSAWWNVLLRDYFNVFFYLSKDFSQDIFLIDQWNIDLLCKFHDFNYTLPYCNTKQFVNTCSYFFKQYKYILIIYTFYINDNIHLYCIFILHKVLLWCRPVLKNHVVGRRSGLSIQVSLHNYFK
jgi:hypothetical protein